jgi:hypothetical protein
MGIFSGLFSSKKRKTQSAVIYLDPVSLGQQIYGQFDLATLEDRLQAALASSNAGVVEGNEFNPGETLVFLYGEDAEALFAAAEPVLRDYPLCRGARVELRDDTNLLRELRLD